MIQPLLNDEFAPITSEIGFLQCGVKTASAAFLEWDNAVQQKLGGHVLQRPVAGDLREVLSSLLPLTSRVIRRILFVPCGQGAWTALFNNARNGTDAFGMTSELSLRLKCRGVRMVCVPHSVRKEDGLFKGRHGANILEVYAPEKTEFLNFERSISLANEGDGWKFDANGRPFSFEKLEQYQAKLVRERFTDAMLREYLLHLGIDAFNHAFYEPEDAVLFTRQGTAVKGMQEFSLAQVRATF